MQLKEICHTTTMTVIAESFNNSSSVTVALTYPLLS
jgi:hypothetical protein